MAPGNFHNALILIKSPTCEPRTLPHFLQSNSTTATERSATTSDSQIGPSGLRRSFSTNHNPPHPMPKQGMHGPKSPSSKRTLQRSIRDRNEVRAEGVKARATLSRIAAGARLRLVTKVGFRKRLTAFSRRDQPKPFMISLSTHLERKGIKDRNGIVVRYERVRWLGQCQDSKKDGSGFEVYCLERGAGDWAVSVRADVVDKGLDTNVDDALGIGLVEVRGAVLEAEVYGKRFVGDRVGVW